MFGTMVRSLSPDRKFSGWIRGSVMKFFPKDELSYCIYELGDAVFQYTMFTLYPVLPSDEVPALCESQVAILSMLLHICNPQKVPPLQEIVSTPVTEEIQQKRIKMKQPKRYQRFKSSKIGRSCSQNGRMYECFQNFNR